MITKILFLVMVCLPFLGNAQENLRQKEAAIVFGGLDSFGITYRIGNAPYLWRFKPVYLNGENNKFN